MVSEIQRRHKGNMDVKENSVYENLKRAVYMSEKDFSTLCETLRDNNNNNPNADNFINIAVIKRKKLKEHIIGL